MSDEALKRYLPADGDFVAGLMEFNQHKHSHPSYASSVVYQASDVDHLISSLRQELKEARENEKSCTQALELARSYIREHDDHVGDCELSQSDGDNPCSCDFGFTLTQIDAALAAEQQGTE